MKKALHHRLGFGGQALLLSCLLAAASHLSAQERYLQPVFDQVTVQTVTYGSNFSIMPVLALGRPVRQQLTAQIYTPADDALRCRPLIIYLHTGGFLPFPVNSTCGGALNDSSNVEIATRLAKMGYVVAVADYRLGWFPTAASETTRRFGFINALYRGVQDVNTCVRYFRKDVAEHGNQFGIDPDKIVVWGQGTGGYVSLAAAYLNQFHDIYTTSDPNKFVIKNPALPGGKYNMVQETVNGNLYATSAPTKVDALLSTATGGLFIVGDTLCVPNHVGYPSNFQLCVNMGGALADSNWLDKGDIPLVSYHVPSDWFNPCKTAYIGGTIIDPMTTQIVEVSGSCDLHYYVEKFGNNDIFEKLPPTVDKYGAIAKARNGGASGFFPFIGTPNNTSAPWEWTSYSGVPKPQQVGCNTNGVSARAYIDTIIGYFAPRAYIALLPKSACPPAGTNNLLRNNSVQMTIMPNPATDQVIISVPDGLLLLGLDLFDASGRLVHSVQHLGSSAYTLHRAGLPSGVYVVKAYFEKGILAQKLVFE